MKGLIAGIHPKHSCLSSQRGLSSKQTVLPVGVISAPHRSLYKLKTGHITGHTTHAWPTSCAYWWGGRLSTSSERKLGAFGQIFSSLGTYIMAEERSSSRLILFMLIMRTFNLEYGHGSIFQSQDYISFAYIHDRVYKLYDCILRLWCKLHNQRTGYSTGS